MFSVRAGEVTVTVLGTAFSVERVADRVGVAVTRGAVQVDWGAGARRMAAGDDGWFPPLVVSPATRPKKPRWAAAKEARSVRHSGGRRRTCDGAGAGGNGADRPRAPVRPSPTPPATDAAKLMADADRARLAGRFEEGAACFERLVREHPDDPRAPLAAFSLGRLLLGELGRPAEAARAFARARALAPDGPLAKDALAREVGGVGAGGRSRSGAGARSRISARVPERKAGSRRDRAVRSSR